MMGFTSTDIVKAFSEHKAADVPGCIGENDHQEDERGHQRSDAMPQGERNVRPQVSHV